MFNNRKNKTFKYNSRFSKDETKDKNAEYATKRESIKTWERTRTTGVVKRKTGLPLLLVLLGIIIAIMYYLEYKIL